MILKLYWRDNNKNTYMLGELYKSNEKYCFDINYDELKKATHNGCFGIGEMKLLPEHQEQDTLFSFFKRRIPPKDSVYIDEIMNEFDMKEYDEMLLLEKTKGILDTDRYFLEAVYE